MPAFAGIFAFTYADGKFQSNTGENLYLLKAIPWKTKIKQWLGVDLQIELLRPSRK
jgi:hypothetical protein